MIKCPKCGRTMQCYTESIFEGIRTVWTCECGYCTRNCETSTNNKTHETKKMFSNTTTSIMR